MRNKYATIEKYQSAHALKIRYDTKIQINPKVFANDFEKANFRIALYNEIAAHPMLGKQWRKLKDAHHNWIRKWIADNVHLKGGEIDHQANRVNWQGLDDSIRSHYLIMWEMLSVLSTTVVIEEEGWTRDFTDEQFKQWCASNQQPIFTS